MVKELFKKNRLGGGANLPPPPVQNRVNTECLYVLQNPIPNTLRKFHVDTLTNDEAIAIQTFRNFCISCWRATECPPLPIFPYNTGFLPGFFQAEAKSIVMQISFVMLIFLLFSDRISGGGKLPQVGRPLPPVKESQNIIENFQTSMPVTRELHVIT